ncbi:MAG: hypothetical protein Q8P68_06440 [Candidatus Peregrinibacteria bacterium]|nr:hypothetical protein [Candidatus Peregrinibacteria bacterium]MDZ4244432.1 hypothetical protein [Candidatus Gracilibacteria bacterium]
MNAEKNQPKDVTKRPHLKEGDPGYDEFYEGQSTSALTKKALELMFKNAEILAKVTEEELAELSKELEESLPPNSYFQWVLEKYKTMEPAKMTLLTKVAGKAPLNEDEILAFTESLTNLDFMAVTEDMVFDLSYLKLVSSGMTSDQRVHLMAKIPEGYQSRAVGIMQKTHMVTSNEVDLYVQLKARQDDESSDVIGDARRYKAKVTEVVEEISAVIDSLPANQKNYKTKPYTDKPKNASERAYTLKNLGLAGGLGVGIMTLVINTSGALRELIIKRDPQAALEHIINHPWAWVAAGTIAGTTRGLTQTDRPIGEIISPGKGQRLGELINQGVSREGIVHLKNENLFYAVQNDFESSKDPEGMRNLSLEVAFPQAYANLKSRGLLPKPHQEAGMVNDFVNLSLSLRKWDYWKSYGAYYRFATYCEKKYMKKVGSEALRRKDEADTISKN